MFGKKVFMEGTKFLLRVQSVILDFVKLDSSMVRVELSLLTGNCLLEVDGNFATKSVAHLFAAVK